MPTSLTLTTADNSLTLPVTVPTRWADVTLAAFVALHTQPDAVPAEVLCGLEPGTVELLSVQAVAHLATLLAFATDPSPVLELLPTPGQNFAVGSMSYGTLLLVQQYIAANPDKPALFYMPRVLALYRTECVHGKYVAAKAEACEAALLAAPVTESYPDAAAFWGACKQWLNGTPQTQPMNQTPKTKRLTRAAKSWRNASGTFSGWMRRLAAPS